MISQLSLSVDWNALTTWRSDGVIPSNGKSGGTSSPITKSYENRCVGAPKGGSRMKVRTSAEHAATTGRFRPSTYPITSQAVTSPVEHPYDFVLEVLQRSSTTTLADQAEVTTRLQALQPALRALRQAYKNPTVSAAYEGDNTEAYLLAYVPHYIKQALTALEKAQLLIYRPTYRAGFFCSGPGPEAVALVEHLLRRRSRQELEFHFLDRASDDWSRIREELLTVGCQRRWSPAIDIQAHTFDLLDRAGFRRLRPILKKLDLAMFQNFGNELPTNQHPLAIDNIRRIAKLLSDGAMLIYSDQRNYEAVQQFVQTLERELRPLGNVRITAMEESVRAPRTGTPLAEHFFTATQWARCHTYSINLVFHRSR